MTASRDGSIGSGRDGSGRQTSIIAHRGFAGVYPENTVAAIREAIDVPGEERPVCVEFDVMPTADGEVVVHHDQTLDRVTDAPPGIADRPVWELPYETVRQFDVLGSGQPVPRLEAVLDAVPPDVRINVELKNPGSADLRFAEAVDGPAYDRQRDRWLPFVERTFEVLSSHPHDLLVSSFYEGALAAARTVDPSVSVATILFDSIQDGLRIARRYDVEAVHPPLNMLPGTDFSTTEYRGIGPFDGLSEHDVLAIAREEGWEVNAWTIETWHEASEARRAGVDGIITDYPDVFRFDAAAGRPRGRVPSRDR